MQGFWFYKLSLNEASNCQTADGTVSVCNSKEPELMGLKHLSHIYRSTNSSNKKKEFGSNRAAVISTFNLLTVCAEEGTHHPI